MQDNKILLLSLSVSCNNIASKVNKKNETINLRKQYFEYAFSFVPT